MAKSYPVSAEKIIQARDSRGLTQEMLAARANVSRSVIASYEAGPVVNASTKVLNAIADALGVTFVELMKEIGASGGAASADPRVTVSPETYAKLQKMAEVDGVPIGAVIARFLDDQREQRAGAAPPPAPKPAPKPTKPTAPPSASKNVN